MANPDLGSAPATDGSAEFSHGAEAVLEDAPIEPSWILEGTPHARVARWSGTRDGRSTNYVWECSAGRFRWYFAVDETVCVVDGEVQVQPETGSPVWLRPGDSALFHAGTWSTWYIPDHLRKHAVLSTPVSPKVQKLLTAVGRAKGLLRRDGTAEAGTGF